MRINDKSDSRSITKKGKEPQVSKTGTGTSAPLFARRLSQVAKAGADYPGKLAQLKDEIEKAGDALEQEPTIVNFKAFRGLLAELAKTVSANAYRMELLGGGLTGRTHEVITVIDKEADLLYHMVMREQKDRIKITAQIIKIKGLVVDFLL